MDCPRSAVIRDSLHFFDLCDISRKMPEEVEGVLRLMGMFATKRTTILSMNENEAVTIGKQLLGGCQDGAEIAHEVRKRYGLMRC
uniref:hypothetical protein n=1 Tax=Clostridium sp. NkU-1 TaxID=1095009 RepID=UPI00326082AA